LEEFKLVDHNIFRLFPKFRGVKVHVEKLKDEKQLQNLQGRMIYKVEELCEVGVISVE
jgi:adenine-specific DNA glycosylase